MSETPGRYDVGGDRPERSQMSIQQLDTKLDILSDQIGRLTEGLTALRSISEQQLEVARLQGDRLSLIDSRLDRLKHIFLVILAELALLLEYRLLRCSSVHCIFVPNAKTPELSSTLGH